MKHRPLHSGRCGTRGNVRVSTHPPRGGGGIAGHREVLHGFRVGPQPAKAGRLRPRHSTRGYSPYAPFGAEAMYARGAWEPARGGQPSRGDQNTVIVAIAGLGVMMGLLIAGVDVGRAAANGALAALAMWLVQRLWGEKVGR